ncbi:MAG: LLM class flavin-dependent oxidoreductase [Chloroflexota bacterium]
MKFSVCLPTCYEGLAYPVGFVQSPDDFLRLARSAEEWGYDSVWGNDHFTTQRYVASEFAEPPNFYDPFLVLTMVAAATSRIRLGTAVAVVPVREPAILAKQAATLDVLSGGRFVLGVGIGAYKEEFEAMRPELAGKNRGAILEEGLEAMRLLFENRRASFRGKVFHFEEVEAFPKPTQRPFPIFVGGHNLHAIERAVKWGQGWLPGWRPFGELREWIAILRSKTNRPIEVSPQFTVTIARTHEEAVQRYLNSGMVQHRKSLAYTGRDPSLALDNNLIGSPDSICAKLAELADMGVDHCCALTFPTNTVDEMLEQMHMFAETVL